MPKLYEYFGLIVLFYSSEYNPIHVHGRYENREANAEIIVENGVITDVRFGKVRGKHNLKPKEMKDFKTLVHYFKEDIVEKWIRFFVYNKPIQSEKITKKLD